MEKTNYRCPICDSTDKWQNVDEYRDDTDKVFKETVDGKETERPMNMFVCNGCGFVGYPNRQQDEEELKAYYKSQYRAHKAPTFNNLLTGQRKVYYHEAFLKDLFKKWTDKDITEKFLLGKNRRFTEIGAAYGMALNYLKSQFPLAEIKGTEWTTKYQRVCFHEYGIKLEDDFDASLKYDLIMSYKVLEHQCDPDKKLREYALALKPEGRIYLSVPTWFNIMTNFGLNGFDLKYYYHPDHINVWSRCLFEVMLKKCGLEIVKEDHVMYGDTYLLKRNDELMKETPVYEKPETIIKAMDHIKQAFEFLKAGKPEKSLEVWADNPTAWIQYYEKNRQKLHREDFDSLFKEVCEPFLKHNHRCRESLTFAADLCMRYEKWTQAAEILHELVEKVPNNGQPLLMLSNALRNMGMRERDPERQIKLMQNCHAVTAHLSTVDRQLMPQAYNWRYKDASEIPTPWELEAIMKDQQNKTLGGDNGR